MLIGEILTAVSILIGVITCVVDKILLRRDRTLNALNELLDSYHRDVPWDKKEKDHFIMT
ncbi:MAG: hypothetical protein IKQ36_09350 [Clostridia bacterium]|nr:hypothetical protein [Clostridia bacterium]